LSPSSQKYEFGIRVPGSGKNLFRIPDPGVQKAPDPGSGSTTLRNGKNSDPGIWDKHPDSATLFTSEYANMKIFSNFLNFTFPVICIGSTTMEKYVCLDFYSVVSTSVADPGSGAGAFLTPGSKIWDG
jgi:hypothetical protein